MFSSPLGWQWFEGKININFLNQKLDMAKGSGGTRISLGIINRGDVTPGALGQFNEINGITIPPEVYDNLVSAQSKLRANSPLTDKEYVAVLTYAHELQHKQDGIDDTAWDFGETRAMEVMNDIRSWKIANSLLGKQKLNFEKESLVGNGKMRNAYNLSEGLLFQFGNIIGISKKRMIHAIQSEKKIGVSGLASALSVASGRKIDNNNAKNIVKGLFSNSSDRADAKKYKEPIPWTHREVAEYVNKNKLATRKGKVEAFYFVPQEWVKNGLVSRTEKDWKKRYQDYYNQ